MRCSAASISSTRVLRALLEPLVELTVVRRGRHVGEVVVVAAAADLSELLLDAARVLLLQEGDRSVQPGALEPPEASCTRPSRCWSSVSPFPRRSPSRAAARSHHGRCRPARSSCRATRGRRRSRRLRARNASVSASNRTTAAFAFPSSGAWVTRTFQAAPYRPTIPGEEAPGETRNWRRELTARA